MRRGNAARRSFRHRIYSVLGFVAVVVIGVTAINLLLGVGKRHTKKLYRYPEKALVEIFARQESVWRQRRGRFASLEELVQAGWVSDEVLRGPVEGYRYRVMIATVDSFVATAEPEGPPAPPEPPDPKRLRPVIEGPRRFFYVDLTHTVRAERSGPAGPESPIIWSPRDSY